MNLSVVIPGRNEEKNISAVVREAKKHSRSVLVIDDGSRDATSEEAEKAGARVLKHAINLGKGAAMRTGAACAIRKGADAIVFMDSDGQHAPKDIPRLAAALAGYDVIFTYRNLRSASMPLTKKAGNAFLDFLLKTLFGIRVVDAQCGYKIMTRDAYEKLGLKSSDYTIESEIAAKAGKKKLRFKQIPIETVYRDKYKGTTVLDGISIALRIVWWRFGI